MALAHQGAASPVFRGSAIVLLVAFVAAMFFVDGASARSGYRFLETGPARAPDIVYFPSYVTVDIRPLGITVRKDPYGSVDVEIRGLLVTSGGELRIWESTRYDASVSEAVGPYEEAPRLVGVLAKWGSGWTQDGRSNILYARIGSTLVIIAGALPPEDLLRIADSLRRSTSSALML